MRVGSGDAGNAMALRLAEACSRFADRIAIESAQSTWKLTYQELASRSDDLLHWLDLGPGQTLVIHVPKGELYYTALAACFLNGIDFCPIDENSPAVRVAETAGQIRAPVVLASDTAVAERLAAAGVTDIRVPDIELPISTARRGFARTDPPTYLIATSGSSGTPKIVVVSHENTIDFVDWAVPFYEINHTTRWSGFSSIGFDLSLVDFLVVLSGGGTLVALSTRMERSRLERTIDVAAITHWHSVPSVIAYILADSSAKRPACRIFTFCGEPLASSDVKNLLERFPGARVINTYGPTEATLFCSYHEVNTVLDMDRPTLPIGTPIPGWNFLFKETPGGFWRLIIESANVARYLTGGSERFQIVDAFGDELRLFDTGDYFTRVNGQTYFAHRVDGMVKLAGNRIDLGEIESRCKGLGLRNPVAFLVAGRLEVVAELGGEPLDDPREALRQILPNYAVPSRIRMVAEHPRTMSGKIDRSAVARISRND
jgi:D-alanine--poly(phosphoribitol) ligase subunit 1